MAADLACPDQETLRQFALGQVSADVAGSLNQHLRECSACAEALRILQNGSPRPTLCETAKEGKGETATAATRLADSPSRPFAVSLSDGGISSLQPAPTDTADELGIVRPSAPTIKMTGESNYDFLAPAKKADELGRLGPYRILSVLGEGGMGVVFKAEDPGLNRLVALKVMKPDKSANDVARERFKQEGRAAARLQHGNIVTIYSVSEDRGVIYLAMQFLQGESLDDRLKREGKLPPHEVIRITREVADGLAVAHDRGLIHRDIKPANIWLEAVPSDQPQDQPREGDAPAEPGTPVGSAGVPPSRRKEGGRVKILDFGLARQIGENVLHLTQTGMVVGTPDYMAPEQARSGQVLDCRCDLFSLGSVMYRMCTGQKPFQGEDIMATLLALAMEDPPPPRFLNPQVPQELSDMIRWMMAKSPSDRPKSARRVIDSLLVIERNLRDGADDLAESYPPPVSRPPPSGAHLTRKTTRRTTTQVPSLRESGKTPNRGSPTTTAPQEKTETRKPEDKETKSKQPHRERLEELGLTPVRPPRQGPKPSRRSSKEKPPLFPATAPSSTPTTKSPGPVPGALATPPKVEPIKTEKPEPQKCPKCGHEKFSSLSWCVSCGYTPPLVKKEGVRASKPISWLWGLVGGTAFVIFITVACHWLLRASGLNWTRWVWTETGIGLAVFVIAHVWNYYIVMPLYGDHTGRMSLNPVHLTACAFRMLPKTQWPICLATWGLTAVVGVAIAVGDISYFWKFKVRLPNPSSPFEFANWSQDKKAENGGEKVELPKRKATVTRRFYVAGYHSDQGKISKVYLAKLDTTDGRYHYIGDAPTNNEALIQKLSGMGRRDQSAFGTTSFDTFKGATWVDPFLWEVEYARMDEAGKLEGAAIK
jgi:serine/threonine protein kinase